MPHRLFVILSIVSVLAAPTGAFACRSTPSDLHIAMATRALQAKKLEPGIREEAERWPAAARP